MLVCGSIWYEVVVFGGIRWYVVVCVGMCCVVGCVSVGVDALAVVWW